MSQKSELDEDDGRYAPSKVYVKKKKGRTAPLYNDSVYTKTENGVEVKRRMIIEKRVIIVRSFFRSDAKMTPTQKMLQLIDGDLKKGR